MTVSASVAKSSRLSPDAASNMGRLKHIRTGNVKGCAEIMFHVWSPAMTSVADFLPDFANDTTIRETEATYKRLIDLLREAHRQSMARIVATRDGTVATTTRNTTNTGLHTPTVKNWALRTGVILPPSGRVTKAIKEQYRAAHAETPSNSVESNVAQSPELDVSLPLVRSWAASEGLAVGSRGRIHPDIVAAYLEAH